MPIINLKKYFLTLILLISFSASAVKESDLSVIYKLLDAKGSFYELGDFAGVYGKNLKYARFGEKTGSKGSLVFLNGWGENIFKYLELFYDLNLLGYSPIYTYDHRGQGFSDRILKNPIVSYVESYDVYVKDFNTFMDQVVLQDLNIDKNRLFLIAHSMGGAIAVTYLEKYFYKQYFKSVVLASPMLKINSNLPRWTEKLLLSVFSLVCIFKCSYTYSPKLDIREKLATTLKNNQARKDFSRNLSKRYPEVLVYVPTFKWILETFKATTSLKEKSRVEKINTSLLLMQATYDDIVTDKEQVQFCNMIPDRCQLKRFDSRHELFLSDDSSRNRIIRAAVNFFQNSLK